MAVVMPLNYWEKWLICQAVDILKRLHSKEKEHEQ